MTTKASVDVEVLRAEIRKTYTEVSTDHDKDSSSRPAALGLSSSGTPSPSLGEFLPRPWRASPG
jgi:hypothetical protein